MTDVGLELWLVKSLVVKSCLSLKGCTMRRDRLCSSSAELCSYNIHDKHNPASITHTHSARLTNLKERRVRSIESAGLIAGTCFLFQIFPNFGERRRRVLMRLLHDMIVISAD